MPLLPLLLLLLGALLPPSLATSPTQSFTNGHMSPRNRHPGAEEGPLRGGRPARLGAAADQHMEVVAVVEQTTPWADTGLDQFADDQESEVVADVVEEPTTMQPKTHEELIAEELQRREEELQSRNAEAKRRAEEQGRRDAELRLRAEEQERRDAELKRRADAAALVQLDLERRTASEVQDKVADIVEKSNPMEPKTHEQLIAEEIQNRAEEQERRDQELRLRAEEQERRDAELKRRADAAALVQAELDRRAEAAAALAAASDPQPDDGALREPAPEHEEEFFRPQSGGRGGFRPSRFHVDETLPEDARNKRHEEHLLGNESQTTDDIELRKQEEARRHTENLSRQEEIEIEHLESGLAHEASGTDQHQREAYEHDLINKEREDMIHKQEMERQRLEKEMEKQEEMRKLQEMERMQREQEQIIQEENHKRHMNMNADTKSRSDAHDWEAHNSSSTTSSLDSEVEESTTMEPKTHEELIAEEKQRREEEQQSRTDEVIRRAEEQGRRGEELKLRAEEQERRDAEAKRLADAAALAQQELDRRAEAGAPASQEEILLAEEQERRDAELRLRAEEQERRDAELKRRADAAALVQAELDRRAEAAAALAAASDPQPDDAFVGEPAQLNNDGSVISSMGWALLLSVVMATVSMYCVY